MAAGIREGVDDWRHERGIRGTPSFILTVALNKFNHQKAFAAEWTKTNIFKRSSRRHYVHLFHQSQEDLLDLASAAFLIVLVPTTPELLWPMTLLNYEDGNYYPGRALPKTEEENMTDHGLIVF